MKTYKVDIFDENSLNEFDKDLSKLATIFETMEFKEFILEKAKKLLDDICKMNLPIDEDLGVSSSDYLSGMSYEIEGDTIILGNTSWIDISAKNMSETTKEKYPAQLSLSHIIEYGIGAVGAGSSYSGQADDWQFDVNNHGDNGWYYKDANGGIHWTRGFEGRYIFYKLSQNIEENIENWISEYLDENL